LRPQQRIPPLMLSLQAMPRFRSLQEPEISVRSEAGLPNCLYAIEAWPRFANFSIVKFLPRKR
jgi:hypothetical protein